MLRGYARVIIGQAAVAGASGSRDHQAMPPGDCRDGISLDDRRTVASFTGAALRVPKSPVKFWGPRADRFRRRLARIERRPAAVWLPRSCYPDT